MESLANLIEKSLDLPAGPAFAEAAKHLRQVHHGRILAILGYGSALRGVDVIDTPLDLYVLTHDFGDVSSARLSQHACRLVPPNVYYSEMPFEGGTLRAKYAVLPLHQFSGWMTADTSNPYFWARFCQPVRLVFTESAEVRRIVVEAIRNALITMFANAKALTAETDPLAIFRAGFSATYRTELRPESSSRANSIVDANAEYYRTAGRLLAYAPPLKASWRRRQIAGKALSLLRLAKAAFTFRGGVDYAAWKIARHSGQKINVTDWNRRHPLLTGLLLLPRLLRKGSLR
jgi:hypothetical protein